MKGLVVKNGERECVLDMDRVTVCDSPFVVENGWCVSVAINNRDIKLIFDNEDDAKGAYLDIKREMTLPPVTLPAPMEYHYAPMEYHYDSAVRCWPAQTIPLNDSHEPNWEYIQKHYTPGDTGGGINFAPMPRTGPQE